MIISDHHDISHEKSIINTIFTNTNNNPYAIFMLHVNKFIRERKASHIWYEGYEVVFYHLNKILSFITTSFH